MKNTVTPQTQKCFYQNKKTKLCTSCTRNSVLIRREDSCSESLRCESKESISSMKTTAGWWTRATANKARTIFSPSPTYAMHKILYTSAYKSTPSTPHFDNRNALKIWDPHISQLSNTQMCLAAILFELSANSTTCNLNAALPVLNWWHW